MACTGSLGGRGFAEDSGCGGEFMFPGRSKGGMKSTGGESADGMRGEVVREPYGDNDCGGARCPWGAIVGDSELALYLGDSPGVRGGDEEVVLGGAAG